MDLIQRVNEHFIESIAAKQQAMEVLSPGIAVAAGLIPAFALLLARLPLNAYTLTEARVDTVARGPESPANDHADV